jgi:ABC-type transport system involved in cytochrome c biogenesis ATPase subunit
MTDTSQSPRYTRRLSDKILIAFHYACDQGETEVAEQLLDLLGFMAKRTAKLPAGTNRRAVESLVAAHERLWLLRHPEALER